MAIGFLQIISCPALRFVTIRRTKKYNLEKKTALWRREDFHSWVWVGIEPWSSKNEICRSVYSAFTKSMLWEKNCDSIVVTHPRVLVKCTKHFIVTYLGWDSPRSTIRDFSSSKLFHCKRACQRLRYQVLSFVNLTPDW
jgi:hypothetical protein